MRWIGVAAVVLVLAGAVFWLRPDDAGRAGAHAGGTGSAGPIKLSTPPPVSSAAPMSASRSASGTVRSAAVLHSAAPNAAGVPAAQPASAPPAAAQAHVERPPAQDEAPPKSAGELFVPFIADDPSQVFASPTVTYHAAVQSEAVDPEWGPAAAAALRDFFSARFGDRFEIPYVDCRQDLCELQIAGRLGSDSQTDMRDAQAAMNDMKRQPWWSDLQFDQESGIVATSPDDRVLLLWFFSRK